MTGCRNGVCHCRNLAYFLVDFSLGLVSYKPAARGTDMRHQTINTFFCHITKLASEFKTLLRTEGFVRQLAHHSPVSQYGQLSRRGRYDALDFGPVMAAITKDIAAGTFADEWDKEAAAGYPVLHALKEIHAGEGVQAMEQDLMGKLGPGVANRD